MDTPLLIGDTAVKSVASGSAPINECIGSWKNGSLRQFLYQHVFLDKNQSKLARAALELRARYLGIS